MLAVVKVLGGGRGVLLDKLLKWRQVLLGVSFIDVNQYLRETLHKVFPQ